MTSPLDGVVQRLTSAGETAPRHGRDPINLPLIRNWLEAMGDRNPLYERESLAPPAMIQVWTMRGLSPGETDPLQAMSAALDEAGFPNVVATDSEQTYHRYLRVGESVSVRSRLESVTGPKRTSLGEGWFVTTTSSWYSGSELVASMRFRILKYRDIPVVSSSSSPFSPVVTADTAFFWDGLANGELRIQRCGECGELRHPPGPACPVCGALKQQHIVASGAGTVHSFVVHHHPPIPGRRAPYTVGLIDLAEGVRMVGEVRGPRPIEIGDPVTAVIENGLPAWRLDLPALEPWTLEVTPTLIISTALATRDFQDVHHDRDAAVRRGGKDIFVNILTTTGLVQRYVTDQLNARVTGIKIRLGTPCFAYDTLTFTGDRLPGDRIAVTGRTASGTHVTGTVTVTS